MKNLKNMNLLRRITLLALVLFVSVSCADDDDIAPQIQETPNLVEAAQQAGLTTLLDAIGAVAGLDQTLLDANAITVFAPDNDAFADVLTAFGVSDLDALLIEIGGVEQLETVLGYHVLPSIIFSEDISDGEQIITTLSGQDITITKSGDTVSLTDFNGNTSNVTLADIEIENGVVHVIDAVLFPELPPANTFSIIANSPDHEILEEWLIETDLDDVLKTGTYTVFAPIDEGFEVFDLSTFTTEDKRNIILYHVLSGSTLVEDLEVGYAKTNATESYSGENNFLDMYIMDNEGTISIGAGNSIVDTNLVSANGVVHTLDIPVLYLPEIIAFIFRDPELISYGSIQIFTDLMQLFQLDAGTSPAPFTVFVPNNNAFDEFYADDNGFDNSQALAFSPFGADVLKYHILADGDVRSDEITDGLAPATLQSENITLNVTDNGITITDTDGNLANILPTVDITTINGVIHVIDKVLLPTLQ
jgi:transforming growth factor-beta-induced protein